MVSDIRLWSKQTGVIELELGTALESMDKDKELESVGVAWYLADQWELLRERADDPEVLVERYEDWVEQADRMVALFKSQGMRVVKVEVDVEEVVAWCKAGGRPFDSKARAEYASETLRKRDLPGTS